MTAHVVLHATRKPHAPEELGVYVGCILPVMVDALAATPGQLWDRISERAA
jgi:hypothetical protein